MSPAVEKASLGNTNPEPSPEVRYGEVYDRASEKLAKVVHDRKS